MGWIIFALGAIFFGSLSDLFRKLGSQLNDPIFSNLMFQTGSYITSIILFLSSRKVEGNPRAILSAMAGGVLIALFTTLSFKALSTGPGLSTVLPVIRIGVVMSVVLLGVLVLKEKLTAHLLFGILFSAIGVYLLFTNK